MDGAGLIFDFDMTEFGPNLGYVSLIIFISDFVESRVGYRFQTHLRVKQPLVFIS